MLFSDIRPFVRFAHTLKLTEKSVYTQVIPLDARLFFVRNGEGKIVADGREYTLKKDDVLIINAGVPYQLCAPQKEVDYTAVNFDYTRTAQEKSQPIPPVSVSSFSQALLLAPVVFEDMESLSRVLFVEGVGELQKRLSDIVSEYTLRLMYFQEKISSILKSCLIDCARTENLLSQAFENQTINEVISYVQENYAQPLTNADIGAIFNYHPNYISRLIKSVTGTSLHQYLIHVRLLKALSLLKNTELSVNEVAIACGFCDAAYFSGYFKRQFKIAPSKFRKV